jgi:hypothetical protein
MLVSLANQVRSRALTLDSLEKQSNEAVDLDATYRELVALRNSVNRVVSCYKLVKDLLPDEERVRLSTRFEQLGHAVRSSQHEFVIQPRQVQPLRQVAESLRLIEADLLANWTAWVKRRVNPLMSTYALVRSLPEMHQHRTEITLLNTEFQSLSQSLPSAEKMGAFNTKVQRYEQLLSGISGFSSQIQHFLGKVVAGTATIADMDDEVLDWCRQPGHSSAFRIAFSSFA